MQLSGDHTLDTANGESSSLQYDASCLILLLPRQYFSELASIKIYLRLAAINAHLRNVMYCLWWSKQPTAANGKSEIYITPPPRKISA